MLKEEPNHPLRLARLDPAAPVLFADDAPGGEELAPHQEEMLPHVANQRFFAPRVQVGKGGAEIFAQGFPPYRKDVGEQNRQDRRDVVAPFDRKDPDDGDHQADRRIDREIDRGFQKRVFRFFLEHRNVSGTGR